MSCRVIKKHTRILSHSAMLALMLGATGCSSDFHRFDQSFYDKAMPTSSEVASANPYPDDVDMQTTASIGSANAFAPAVGVGEVPQVIYTTPGTANSGRQTLDQMNSGYNQAAQSASQGISGGQPETYQSYRGAGIQAARQNYGNTVGSAQGAYQGTVSQANSQINNAKQTYNTYKTVNSLANGTDNITTGSISQARQLAGSVNQLPKLNYTEETDSDAQAKAVIDKVTNGEQAQETANAAAQRRSAGWSAIGGTSIQVAAGETLYNLSKRFGVPVDALMEVNQISDPSTVKSGQSIIIPTYVYSKDNPISAPDANPRTRAARASTGNIGEAQADKAPIPVKRPEYMNLSKSPSTDEGGRPWTVEMTKNDAQDEQVDPTTTGSITKPADKAAPAGKAGFDAGKYQVQKGDTLYGVARKTGVSIGAIVAANGIENNIVKIGQWLVIPDGSAPVKSVAAKPKHEEETTTAAKTVEEPTKTAETKQVNQPEPYVKPDIKQIDETVTASIDGKTLARSGFGNWRKPVHGRVISQFGETRNGSRNDGVDISVPEGTPVKSVENGVVIYSSNELQQFGNLVLIRHDDGFVSAYANLKNFVVNKGDEVRRGQIIGRSGRTGNVSQPQLHFELRKNSNPVDPLQYFDAT